MTDLEDDPPRHPGNTKWQRAGDFIATVREQQRRRGKGMGGQQFLPDADLALIDRILQDRRDLHPAVKSLEEAGGDARQLFGCFAEMCRRNKTVIPRAISREIFASLAVELLANIEELGVRPARLIAATVQNGVLGLGRNPQLSATFADMPSAFKLAAVNHPSDPEGFLTGVSAMIGRLERDERFASLRDTPGIFRRAAVSHPSDPEGFLTGIIAGIGELERDQRFASLRGSPYIFRHAVANNSADPEGFLSGIIACIGRFEQDERFASLRGTPGVFRRAAMSHPSDPAGFLTGVLASIGRLERDERFASLRGSPYIFKHAAVSHPSDPEGFLIGMMAQRAKKREPGGGVRPPKNLK